MRKDAMGEGLQSLNAEKAEMRAWCLRRRAALGEEDRSRKSGLILEKVWALPEFQKARTVMSFLNFRDEVETTVLAEAALAEGKRLVLPRCGSQRELLLLAVSDLRVDLERGTWGIREPRATLAEVEPSELEVVLVPGVGFDLQGNRLGYGGGYYDRFFQRLPTGTARIALAFACQIVRQVPVDQHDVKMTMLVTEKEVYQFSG